MKRQYNSDQNGESFETEKEQIRKNLLKYTRKAFLVIPQIEKPRILDIGCGSGIPTLELARLSQGEVTGIDIDQPALDKLTRKVAELKIDSRIRVLNQSMFDMDLPDECFDIIWAEGSIFSIGFGKALREWRRFLKPGGFLVIHDEQGNIKSKLKQIPDLGYKLLNYFLLGKETWWAEYFSPLEKLTVNYLQKYPNNTEIPQEIQKALDELEMLKGNPDRNSSIYIIMEKKY